MRKQKGTVMKCPNMPNIVGYSGPHKHCSSCRSVNLTETNL